MSNFINNRVLWTEGMLLTPQHFQQHDRFVEYSIQHKYALLQPYFWGFKAIKFSEELLLIGKLRLLSCIAVFPNGIFYNAPDIDLLPGGLDINNTMIDQIIYLEIDNHEVSPYTSISCNIFNIEHNKQEAVKALLGQLRVKLLVKAADEKSSKRSLPISKIKAIDSKGSITLSTYFIPPCLDYKVSTELNNYIERLLFIIKKPLINYFQRIRYDSSHDLAEIQTCLLMQSLSRFYGFLQYAANNMMIHPNQLYSGLISFLYDLVLYDPKEDYLLENHPYQHNQLNQVFHPIFDKFFKLLTRILKIQATKTALIFTKDNLWVSEKAIPPFNILKSLILSIYAPTDTKLMKQLSHHEIKVTFLNKINDLICYAIPGMTVKRLKNLPVVLIEDKHTSYFSIEINNENCLTAQKIACYFNTSIKNLELSLWHIQKS